MPSSPILGSMLPFQNWESLDLSATRLANEGIDHRDNRSLTNYIFNGRTRYGGYGEQRSIYTRSQRYDEELEPRNIHLGLDIWNPAGTAIYSPWPGVIHSVHDNNNGADYGPTIIIAHQIDDERIHALYGHLSRRSLDLWHSGDEIEAGDILGHMGEESENGGWPPHLHFQLIKELPEGAFDYPGVCRASEWSKYHSNCPDPLLYLYPKP